MTKLKQLEPEEGKGCYASHDLHKQSSILSIIQDSNQAEQLNAFPLLHSFHPGTYVFLITRQFCVKSTYLLCKLVAMPF